MPQNTSACIKEDSKPVNINISFNINRKQVTQNINNSEKEKSFSAKNTHEEEHTPTLKPKNYFHRASKTP